MEAPMKKLWIAAALLVAMTGAAGAAEGKPSLHCAYGSIVVDVDESDTITSNLPTGDERVIELTRNASGAKVVVRSKQFDSAAHDGMTCEQEYPNTLTAPWMWCDASHNSEDGKDRVYDNLFTVNGTFETGSHRPNGQAFGHSIADSGLSAVLIADDGVALIRDGPRAMLITPRGRVTCFTRGSVGGVRSTFARSDADLIAEARQNARANQDAMKLFATATCKFDNGFVIDHGVLFAEGHPRVQAVVSKSATGYAVSALHGEIYVDVSPSGAAALGTHRAPERKDGRPLDPYASVALDELVYRNVPLRGSCTGLTQQPSP
jgi:hypothetical protein